MPVMPQRRLPDQPPNVDAVVTAVQRMLADRRGTLGQVICPQPGYRLYWLRTGRMDWHERFCLYVECPDMGSAGQKELLSRYRAAGYDDNHAWTEGEILIIRP